MADITTKELKELWNEAVKATLTEVKKYDGIIPSDEEREYLVKQVSEKVMYKIKK